MLAVPGRSQSAIVSFGQKGVIEIRMLCSIRLSQTQEILFILPDLSLRFGLIEMTEFACLLFHSYAFGEGFLIGSSVIGHLNLGSSLRELLRVSCFD